MELRTLITAGIGVFCLSVACNVVITNHMQAKQLQVIIETLDTPKIKFLDMDALVDTMLKNGMNPTEMLAHVDNINKSMRLQNVLLLDSKSIISAPERYKMEKLSQSQLIEYLNSHGVEPSDPEKFLEATEATRKMLELN